MAENATNLSQSNGRQHKTSLAEILAPYNARGCCRVHPNRFCIAGDTVILFCRAVRGLVFGVWIDRSDLVRVLKAGSWKVANFDRANGRTNLYAYCKINGKSTYLHRFILNAPPKSSGLEVDHLHQRTLDCRRSEIRLATKSENQRNRREYAQ